MPVEGAVGIKGEEMEQASATTPTTSTIRTKRARPKSSATLKTPVAAPPGGEGGPEDRDHMYRGVRQRRWGRWVSEVREPNRGKRHWLGTFDTAVDATLAYDRAAVAIYGSHAIVNFPSAFFISTAQPVQCHPPSSSPAAVASVFVEHKLRPMLAAASVLTEHGVKPMMAAASILDEHEVKPVITASVFGEREVKPMVAASVFEVKPMVAASVFHEHEVKPVITASVFGEREVKPMVAASVFGEREVEPMVAASVFHEREVKPMVPASVFGEREVKPMVAASDFGVREMKPMVAASVFGECEVKPIVAASVFGEHEVKPMPVHGVGDDTWIAQHWDASWAEREEVYADYLKDIAMYIDVDAITEKLAYHPDIYGKDYQVDGFDAEFTVSPLWELGD
ncbi:hypothetical protein ACQJBY_002999 [Aegilops geniculata]